MLLVVLLVLPMLVLASPPAWAECGTFHSGLYGAYVIDETGVWFQMGPEDVAPDGTLPIPPNTFFTICVENEYTTSVSLSPLDGSGGWGNWLLTAGFTGSTYWECLTWVHQNYLSPFICDLAFERIDLEQTDTTVDVVELPEPITQRAQIEAANVLFASLPCLSEFAGGSDLSAVFQLFGEPDWSAELSADVTFDGFWDDLPPLDLSAHASGIEGLGGQSMVLFDLDALRADFMVALGRLSELQVYLDAGFFNVAADPGLLEPLRLTEPGASVQPVVQKAVDLMLRIEGLIGDRPTLPHADVAAAAALYNTGELYELLLAMKTACDAKSLAQELNKTIDLLDLVDDLANINDQALEELDTSDVRACVAPGATEPHEDLPDVIGPGLAGDDLPEDQMTGSAQADRIRAGGANEPRMDSPRVGPTRIGTGGPVAEGGMVVPDSCWAQVDFVLPSGSYASTRTFDGTKYAIVQVETSALDTLQTVPAGEFDETLVALIETNDAQLVTVDGRALDWVKVEELAAAMYPTHAHASAKDFWGDETPKIQLTLSDSPTHLAYVPGYPNWTIEDTSGPVVWEVFGIGSDPLENLSIYLMYVVENTPSVESRALTTYANLASTLRHESVHLAQWTAASQVFAAPEHPDTGPLTWVGPTAGRAGSAAHELDAWFDANIERAAYRAEVLSPLSMSVTPELAADNHAQCAAHNCLDQASTPLAAPSVMGGVWLVKNTDGDEGYEVLVGPELTAGDLDAWMNPD